ncbi:hydrolase [Salinibaculum rarum]|uniref:hydrolase n=1 Tax=Salinibaculum rarum TaxID=3058903 RepID=UPI00265F8E94|nr:hydrolase [Salinibaculum sp. KK48]
MFEEWRATAVGGTDEQSVSVPGKPAAFAGADGVTYVTRFDDPRGPSDDAAVIELRGLYAHAEVDVTGERLDGEGTADHHAYFDPLRIPILPYEENELSVTCHAPRDRFGGIHDTDAVPDAAAVPGIWWGATVEGRPLPYIDEMRVRPELTDDGAVLHVRTTVVSEDPIEDRITYSLKPEGDLNTGGMMNRGRVETSGPGKTTVEHTIDVHDPSLWWPREFGQQNRYRLTAKLGNSEHSITTGIREVARDGPRLVVNGQEVPIRGVTTLTDDPDDVQRAIETNANLLRARAHALPREVYEACDERGLLVWQDLPLTGPGGFDTERGRTLAAALADTYGTHPSFAAVAVHDEPTAAFADGLGDGVFDGLRLRWRGWRNSYDRSDAEAVADALPAAYPVVPVVGEPGIDHDAAAYYPGWDYGTAESIETLLDRYPTDILAGFGAGSLAEAVDAAAGFDAEKHARYVDAGVSASGDSEDSSAVVEASQAYQAETVRTVAERARCRGLGAIAATLRDTDAAGMGVYDADGNPKAAQETLAAAFQPAQVFLPNPGTGKRVLVVRNDGPKPLSATVSWEAAGEGTEQEITVEGTGRWRDDIQIPGGADSITLTLTASGGTVENHYEL